MPTVNGCGPAWFPGGVKVPQGSGRASFAPSCNVHDVCYEICNGEKKKCDDDFEEDMNDRCRRAYPFPEPGGDDEEFSARATCLSRARLYANLVQGLADSAWEDAQKVACECCRGWKGTLSVVVSGEKTTQMTAPPMCTSTWVSETKASGELVIKDTGGALWALTGSIPMTRTEKRRGACMNLTVPSCTGTGSTTNNSDATEVGTLEGYAAFVQLMPYPDPTAYTVSANLELKNFMATTRVWGGKMWQAPCSSSSNDDT